MTETVMTQAGDAYDERTMTRFTVDEEHTGIRVALPLLAVGAFMLIYWGLPPVLAALSVDSAAIGLVASIPGGIVAAAVVLYLGDRFLKRVWPSKRALLMDDRFLVLQRPGRPDQVLRRDAHINMLAWRFRVSRRGRVPKGHWCVAFQLMQDDAQFALYAFCPPKPADTLTDFEMFTLLASRKAITDQRASLRAAGQQRRLLQAEEERWQDGAELSLDDFRTVWAEVSRYEALEG